MSFEGISYDATAPSYVVWGVHVAPSMQILTTYPHISNVNMSYVFLNKLFDIYNELSHIDINAIHDHLFFKAFKKMQFMFWSLWHKR